MLKLVRRARIRLLRNELLAGSVNTACAALAACLLLLVLGADTLKWEWLAAAPVAAAVFCVYRARKRTPPEYAVAQMLDRRLGFHDTISSALHFSRVECAGGPCQWLRAQADMLSRGVDLRKAVPYTAPRSLYALGGLFLLVSSLFALRYAVTQRLDLKAPLASILPINLGSAGHPQQADSTQRQEEEKTPRPDDPGAERGEPRTGRRPAASDQAKSDTPAAGKTGSRRSESAANQTAEQSQESPQNGQGQMQEQGGRQNGESGQSQGERDRQASAENQAGQQNGSGLMDRVRGAMRSLLSHFSPQQSAQAAGTQASSQSGSRSQASNRSATGQEERAASGARQQSQGQSRQGSPAHPAQGSSSEGAAPGGGESRDPASKPGAGAGSEDGAKEIREAEQLAAMGKISEIIGKRAADLSGEVTVEVESTSQQLHTPYASRKSSHVAGGTEIGRDEVPVALQSYVEQYFEMVRKRGTK